jgi:hypothetical protein
VALRVINPAFRGPLFFITNTEEYALVSEVVDFLRACYTENMPAMTQKSNYYASSFQGGESSPAAVLIFLS